MLELALLITDALPPAGTPEYVILDFSSVNGVGAGGAGVTVTVSRPLFFDFDKDDDLDLLFVEPVTKLFYWYENQYDGYVVFLQCLTSQYECSKARSIAASWILPC